METPINHFKWFAMRNAVASLAAVWQMVALQIVRSRIVRSLIVTSLIAMTWTTAQAQPKAPQMRLDIPQAERLLREGKAEDAYRLLLAHEFEQAGQEDFDYILGVAALESGKADLATLIFERVLAVNPNHAAARLDMGRAYFALGDLDRARIEFESARRFAPPPAAQTTIDQYMAAIDKQTSGKSLRITGYADTTLGRDSNVNSSTAQGSLFIPLFATSLTLDTNSVKRGDNFLSFGGGVDASYALSERFSLLGGADAKRRANYRADTFDSQSVDMRVGAQYAGERDTLRLNLAQNRYDLDNASYRNTQNVVAEWRRTLDTRTQISFFGQDSRGRNLQAASRSNSSNVFMAGLGGVRVIDEGTRTFAFASMFRGVDVATDSRADGDKRLHGARIGMQRALMPAADWFASVSSQKSTYSLENPTYVATRRDYQYDLATGVNWQINRDWLLRPQISYTRNDSTLVINDFDRYEGSITLRRDFR